MGLKPTWVAGQTNHKRVRERLEMGLEIGPFFLTEASREKEKNISAGRLIKQNHGDAESPGRRKTGF